MLLRRGLAGLMPESMLWNPSKGLQAADLIFRLLHHRPQVTEKLHRLKTSAMAREYLDIPRLEQAWQIIQGKQNAQTTNLAAGLFMRGIGAGSFLELVD